MFMLRALAAPKMPRPHRFHLYSVAGKPDIHDDYNVEPGLRRKAWGQYQPLCGCTVDEGKRSSY
jgi:hypothetical protein